MKKWLIFAGAMCLAVILAACGANSNNQESTETGGAVANDSGSAAAELVISAHNWEFDQAEYKIKAGEATNISLKSTDGVHGIQIKNVGASIGTGKTKTVTVDEPGTYEIICNVPCGNGHGKMKAMLVVE